MINLTRLYCDVAQPMDHLRYGRGHGSPATAAERRPIVVWNITRRCNLKCVHCYSDSDAREYPGELTWDQCRAVIDDLAAFGVPGLLLSGGEPLIHPRFFDLACYARERGLRLTISTNGTLITPEIAARLHEIGFAYVGISLDGISNSHGLLIEIQRAMIHAARKIIFCLDHTKLGRQSISTLCGLDVVDTIVTDQAAPAEMIRALRRQKIEVILAGE